MPTLTDEICKIVNSYISVSIEDGRGYISENNFELLIDDLLSLIQSTVKGCVPEKVEKEETNCGDGCCHDIFYSGGYAFTSDEEMEGFNQCLDTITANLKSKGLL